MAYTASNYAADKQVAFNPYGQYRAATAYKSPTVPTSTNTYGGVKPEATVGRTDQETQRLYNQARLNMTGATKGAAQTLTDKMGGVGFVPGQSGVADTALGNVYSEGLNTLGSTMAGIASNEQQNRFANQLELDKLNQSRYEFGKSYGANREDATMNSLLSYMNLMQNSQASQYSPYWSALGSATTYNPGA